MNDRHTTRTAVFILLERNGRYFFLRRKGGWGEGLLTVPAGHVDKGEGVRDAAMREAKEETGISFCSEDLEFLHVDYIKDRFTDFYFRVKTWEGDPGLKERETASEAIWIPKNELPDDIVPQIKNLLKQMKKRSYFSELEMEN